MADLYASLTSYRALDDAFRRARRGKRGQPEEAAFYLDHEIELLRLSEQLRARTYEPEPYSYFEIRRPKPRTISVAAFRDRVVHHALIGALEPIFEARFYRHSYACRRGKGTHRALAWCRYYARRFPYFLKLDVSKYFDHVDHAVLLDLIAARVDDPDVLWLCTTILDHARVPTAPPDERRGIPIGNLTSQFWGNVTLDPLDRLLVERCPGRVHLRYMDDVICFGHTKRQLHETHDLVRDHLDRELHLTLKRAATVLAPVTEGIAFLGFRVFPGTVRLQRTSLVRYTRKLRRALDDIASGALVEEDGAAAMASLTGFAAAGDTWRFRRQLLARLEGEGRTG